jgi:5-methylcytosine-specific restriction endonuclease McrA
MAAGITRYNRREDVSIQKRERMLRYYRENPEAKILRGVWQSERMKNESNRLGLSTKMAQYWAAEGHKERISGENSPNWNPDKTDEERRAGRKYPAYYEWRQAVYERDNYTCTCCGERGGRLNAHHVFNFSDYPNLRTDVNNGVAMCRSCHDDFHRVYGRRNNTLTQFVEFLHAKAKEVNETDAMDSFISRLGCDETRPSTAC